VTLVEETLNVVTDDEGHQIRVVDEVVMDEDGTEIEVLEVDVTEGKA
jgi:hypothetical protein